MKRTLTVLFVVIGLIVVIGFTLPLLDNSQAEQEYRTKNKERIDALLRGESVPCSDLYYDSPAFVASQLHYPEEAIKRLRKAEYVLPKQ